MFVIKHEVSVLGLISKLDVCELKGYQRTALSMIEPPRRVDGLVENAGISNFDSPRRPHQNTVYLRIHLKNDIIIK